MTAINSGGIIGGQAELFRLIVESAEEYAIFTIDMAAQVVSWNVGAERILGYKEEEILGKHIGVIFTSDDKMRERLDYEMQTSLQSGRVSDTRWHVRKGGAKFWADGHMMPLKDDSGRTHGFVKIIRDRTSDKLTNDERDRLLKTLADKDQKKDAFLAMLAHELRNPLSTISNAVNICQYSKKREQTESAIGMIGQQVKQLTRLIDDLLDVSRITLGKIELQKTTVDARDILTNAIEVIRPLIQSHKHELTTNFSGSPLWLEGDPARLEQIFTNLITNASKYTNKGGHIWVNAQRVDSIIFISVRDNGIGIPPEKLSAMFELFAQEDPGITRSQGGLGVGLTLARSLTQMHGGTIVAKSEGRGKGCEFIVQFPAAANPKIDPTAIKKDPGLLDKTKHPARIIIVDDNKDSASTLSSMLTILGHEVETAFDGLSGIKLASRFRPRFVLLDIGLPGMDGYEVAKELRQKEESKNMIIIALSGYGQESDLIRAREAGFDYHLIKPLDYESLNNILMDRGRDKLSSKLHG